MNANERQLDIIRRRYSNERFNVVHNLPRRILETRLGHVSAPSDFRGMRVLEIGAGCSAYLQLFLDYGCRELVANDLIPERLALNGITDSRYREVAGDLFLLDPAEASFDVVFANLTMMFLIPMLDQLFAKLVTLLKPGGILLNCDPNYLCPLTIYRNLIDRSGANPAKAFLPGTFKKSAERAGFTVNEMVPFTGDILWTTGNWFLGTSFAMRSTRTQSLSTV